MGTPPQSFIMAIDIEWDALFVPSSDCYSQFCDSNDISMFNATNSSTYYGGHESMTFNYAGMHFNGAISKDTLSFNGLEIKIQPFVEATDIWPGGFFNWYFGYSGVIGFAPGFDPHREQQVESPWQMLVKTHDLDENVFSIKLPSGIRHLDKPRSDGELTIGGLDPACSDLDFIHLPLAEENLTSWSVKVQSLTWGDGRSLHQDFSNCMARFYTSIPYILLPQLWADQLLDLIGAMQPKGMFMAFPCENRETLPDLTFLLAGETIALTSFEYSFEMTFGASGGEEPSCVVGFDDAEEDTMVLGWPFLQNFISVFDQDAREVRCKSMFERREPRTNAIEPANP